MLIAPGTASLMGQRSLGQEQDAWVLELPTRRAPDAPPGPPPALPAGADRVGALTIKTVIRHQAGSGTVREIHQTITRTAERIHIAAENGREWLFERNPVDTRRVSASLVDHEGRSIIRYEETDLRMVLGLRGWLDVLTLGFNADLVPAGTRSSEVDSIGGISFTRHHFTHADGGAGEVWWSDELALPGRFTHTSAVGVTTLLVDEVREGVDTTLLLLPAARFPKYREFDLADWLEHH